MRRAVPLATLMLLACSASQPTPTPGTGTPASAQAAPATPTATAVTSAPPGPTTAATVQPATLERWKPVVPTKICGGRGVVRVEYDCTCGERLRCTVALDSADDPAVPIVHVTLEQDENSFGACDDCYPGSASCQAPTLPATPSAQLVVGEHRFEVNTNRAGRLPLARCWTFSPTDRAFTGPSPDECFECASACTKAGSACCRSESFGCGPARTCAREVGCARHCCPVE